MKSIILILFVLFCLGICSSCYENKVSNKRPNIILILSDDMGYSDIGCYGGEINTPNLDGLAENGLRFTQFYNAARCCPTRASILTGLYPHQAGFGHMTRDYGTHAYQGDLSSNAVTIGEVLKQAGYATYISGKWHVTPYKPNDESPTKHNWPLQRGFDKFYGTILGAGSYYDPTSLTRNNEYIIPEEEYYFTDAITDNAVKYIKEHDTNKPFFMYLAYTAAHWPLQAKPDDIAKYKGKFDEGWDVLRQKKYQRLIDMGIIKPEWILSEKEDGIKDWEEVKNKSWYSSLMEVYAAMVDCMDQGIGKVMNTLEEKGLKDNTLVFFVEDNGGCAERFGLFNEIRPYHKDVSADDFKPMGKNERQKEMVPMYTRDGRPVFGGTGLPPGPDDTYLSYGKPWANASNTPFRMYKHYVHEGGISTPLIVHWPNGIKEKNQFVDQPSHIIDIMATCVDVAKAKYPEMYNGKKITPMAGVSLLPALHNQKLSERPICWEHEGNKAIRFGRYKLVSRWKKGSDYNWELYDMEEDRTETNDLAGQLPAKVTELELLWKEWARETGVLTWKTFKAIQ